jgi:hypothetical protein
MHKAILDIAARVTHLDSPMYAKVIFHTPTIAHIKVVGTHKTSISCTNMSSKYIK